MTPKQETVPRIFDACLYHAKIARAKGRKTENSDFLVRLVLEDLCLRISAVNREFKSAYTLFSPIDPTGFFSRNCPNVSNIRAIATASGNHVENQELDLCRLIPENSADLIVCPLGLFRENDLPGWFARINMALKPDGLFLCVLPAEQTLSELRQSLLAAETELTGGAAMRVDPFIDVRTAGGLLQRANFSLPVADIEDVTVRYGGIQKLVSDLRSMAATQSFIARPTFPDRRLFSRAEEIYLREFGDPDSRIRATFSFLHLSGWKSHTSQQKPARRGSATHQLADFLNSKKSV